MLRPGEYLTSELKSRGATAQMDQLAGTVVQEEDCHNLVWKCLFKQTSMPSMSDTI